MNRVTRTAVVAGLAAAAVAVRRLLRQAPAIRSLQPPEDRWLVLTVDLPQEEIAPHNVWPQPLADLGDAVEIELRRAPGNRGTEIAVRQRDPEAAPSSSTSRIADSFQIQEVRAALRKTKQLLETGEVLNVDPQPHGPRKPTPGGALIAAGTKRAGREGVL
jgi:hypothetical protein